MRVLYINTHYNGGGAEKISRQLYIGEKEKGIETYFMAGRNSDTEPDNIDYVYDTYISKIPTYLIGSRNHNVLKRTIYGKKRIISYIKKNNIDIVHFHNIHGNYMGLEDLEDIYKACSRIVITLHDMWLITGCCPYSIECNNWMEPSECANCKGNVSMPEDVAKANKYLELKKNNITGRNIIFVSPSKWLQTCAKHGILENEDVRLINNGVDLSVFKQLDKSQIKQKYGLPSDKKILLFVAHSITSPYKGYGILQEALKQIEKKDNYFLLIIGQIDNSFNSDIDYKCLGFISDEKIMNEAYAASDLFITPSIADTFPLVALESLASGTPVVCFNTGGIPEIVNDEVGIVVNDKKAESLKVAIENICSDSSKLKWLSSNCRKYIEKHYSIDKMIEAYKDVYMEIMNR